MPKEINEENNLKEKKEDFSALLAKIDEMSKSIIDLKEENKRLSFASNKSLLNIYDNRQQKEKTKEVKIGVFRNKMVVAWTDMPVNICEKNANGNRIEDQKMTFIFSDGTMAENVPYMEWIQRTADPVKATVIEEKYTKDKHIIYNVKTEQGETLDIDILFANP